MTLRKAISFCRIIFPILLLALATGQSPATTPATKPALVLDWGKSVDGNSLAAFVDKTKFDGVEGIVVHVHLSGPGGPPGPLHRYSCRVTREGKPCEMTAFGKGNDMRNSTGFGLTGLDLPFNDVYDFPCSRVVDMTLPGTYTIVIERAAPYAARHTVESKPIKIEVADEPSP